MLIPPFAKLHVFIGSRFVLERCLRFWDGLSYHVKRIHFITKFREMTLNCQVGRVFYRCYGIKPRQNLKKKTNLFCCRNDMIILTLSIVRLKLFRWIILFLYIEREFKTKTAITWPKQRNNIMREIVLVLIIVGVWFLLQAYILPKLGISTWIKNSCQVTSGQDKPEKPSLKKKGWFGGKHSINTVILMPVLTIERARNSIKYQNILETKKFIFFSFLPFRFPEASIRLHGRTGEAFLSTFPSPL